MEHHIIYVGLDVHKETIAVALAGGGQRGEVREHGKVANTPNALKTLGAKLARNGARLRFCYEAGPCGYGIQRQLSEAGHDFLGCSSGPPGGFEVSQLHLPLSGPDGQPIASSHLDQMFA